MRLEVLIDVAGIAEIGHWRSPIIWSWVVTKSIVNARIARWEEPDLDKI